MGIVLNSTQNLTKRVIRDFTFFTHVDVTPGSLKHQSTASNQKRIGTAPIGCLPRGLAYVAFLCVRLPLKSPFFFVWQGKRAGLMHDLYAAYWVRSENLADDSVISHYASKHELDPTLVNSKAAKSMLRDNTQV